MKELTRTGWAQQGADNVGIIPGADLPSFGTTQFPCEECGGMVDLTSPIRVRLIDMVDGEESETFTTMPEADARALLGEVGLPQPPVMCDKHERFEFEATVNA